MVPRRRTTKEKTERFMAIGLHDSPFKNPVIRWIDQRMPVFTMMQKEYGTFPTPKNFNYFWNFGALAMINLMIMIATGIFLSMHYTPHTAYAFDSVERIMRDVNFGWLLRYVHMNGASMFFIVVYIHIWRGMYYGSYKAPRELLWILGVVIFLLMMATAFMGYVLPWGQMSFWGATVITNLFSAIPVVGPDIVVWLWGGFSVDNPTLNRFFSLHYLLPFVIAGVVFLHVAALHITGSNNPLGVEPKGPQDTLPFHPYYTVKDSVGIIVYFMVFGFLVFFMPNYLGHPDNYIPANPLVTPPHIVPEWYFLPFYAVLRAVPDKLGGVLLMFGSIAVLFVLPWLDSSPVRSMRFRPVAKWAFHLWWVNFFVLMYCGAKPAEQPYVFISQVATAYYFAYFLVILPLLSRLERPLPLPESISRAVLGRFAGGGPLPAGAAAQPMEKS
jgi:ubiquinol-cytochrome c reductase cytochrome b/c1 subunit